MTPAAAAMRGSQRVYAGGEWQDCPIYEQGWLGAEALIARQAIFLGLRSRQLCHCRRDMQIIFQDPLVSLNLRMTVEELIAEPFGIHGLAAGPDRTRRILPRQLQQELELSYLFIAHGMAVVKRISHRVAVMYLGKIMEILPTCQLYSAPLHPYSEALISAISVLALTVKRHRIILAGDIPSQLNVPSGCPCAAFVGEKCRTVEPTLSDRGDGRWVACHLRQKPRAGDISVKPT